MLPAAQSLCPPYKTAMPRKLDEYVQYYGMAIIKFMFYVVDVGNEQCASSASRERRTGVPARMTRLHRKLYKAGKDIHERLETNDGGA